MDKEHKEKSAQMMEEKLCDNGGNYVENQRQGPILSGICKQLTDASLDSHRTLIIRLLHIADRCGDNLTMELEALRMAYEETKKGEDANLFRQVAQRIDGRLGPNYVVDSAWIEAVERRFWLKIEKLDNELKVFPKNFIRENTRMSYDDSGDVYFAHGKLQNSLQMYIHFGNHSSTAKHTMTNVANAEQIPKALDPVIVAKLQCATGLAYLEAKRYKLAACKDLSNFMGAKYVPWIRRVGEELGNNYLIAPQDVATYGGLCALATFDRSELKNKVIDNVVFRNFLELKPEIRELINVFYLSHCASCLDYMENLKASLLLDIHLRNHIETLYNEIRHKALIQYTLPFVSLDLNMMANAFKTSVAGLQKELEALISEGHIRARIDSHNKVLYAHHADQRKSTFQRVLQKGADFGQDVSSMLLRANLVKFQHALKHKQPNFLSFQTMQARIDSHDKVLYAHNAHQRNSSFQRKLYTQVDSGQNVTSMPLKANMVKFQCALNRKQPSSSRSFQPW